MDESKLDPGRDIRIHVDGPRPQAMTTTVQVTPMKAPAEMADAIRRQRRTTGIGYTYSDAFTPRVASGGHKRSTTQYAIVNPSNSGENGNGTTATVNGQIPGSRDSKSNLDLVSGNLSYPSQQRTARKTKDDDALVKTVIGNPKGYSVVYTKPHQNIPGEHHSSINTHGGRSHIGSSATISLARMPRLTVPSDPQLHRAPASDWLTRRHRDTTPHDNAIEDTLFTNKWNQDASSLHPTGRLGFATPTSPRWNYDETFTSARTNSPRLFVKSPSQMDIKTHPAPATRSLNSWMEPQPSPGENNSFIDLANTVMGSVTNDLNQIYQICHSRVRYSDILGKKLHSTSDSSSLATDSSNSLQPNDGRVFLSPTSLRASSPPSSPAPSPVISPRRTLPDLKPRPSFQKTTVHINKSPWWKHSEDDQNTSEPETEFSPLPEPEIDYDKPITIIFESDDRQTTRTRPILKQTSRSSPYVYSNGDVNNNKTTLPVIPSSTASKNISTSTFNVHAKRAVVDLDSAGQSSLTRDKGRLVRFNADPKIYEFAPSEPVLAPK